MISQDEILARLQKGEDIDTIANEFANILNAAIQENKRQEEVKQKRHVKAKAADELAERIQAFIVDFYPDLYSGETEFTGAQVIEILDGVSELYTGILGEIGKIFDKGDSPDAITEFLRKNGVA